MQTNYFNKALLVFFLALGCTTLQAQVKIGNNPQNIDLSSVLELESTNKAFVITRVNTVQMTAIVPLEGAMVYNTDEQCLHYYDGTEWINICEAFGNNLTFTSEALANPGNFETITITQDTPTNYNFEVGLLNASNIQDGTIGTAKLVDGSVTQTKLATNSVNSQKIADKSIQTIDIAPGLPNTVLQTNDIGDTVLWAQLDASTITGRDLTQGDNSITITNGLGATLEDTNVRVTDGGISTAKLEDNAVTTAKILDANITDAKLDKANISVTGFALPTADVSMGTFKLTDVVDPTDAQDAATKNYVDTEISASKTLTDASIFIGDATNTAQALPITGEVTLTNAGVVTINDDAITTAKIADGAATVDKIGATPADAGSFLMTNALGVPEWRSALATVDDTTIEIDILTGQLRVKDDGISTAKIADNAVTPLKIDATIAGSGLSRDITTGVLSVNGAGVAGDGNITSTDLDVSGDTNALLGDVVIDINAAAVTTTKIADDAVTAAKINADVAGEGLEKNTTTGVLDVSVDNATIEIDATNGLQVLANGITVTQIADNAVTPLKIDATIAGTGISRDAITGILSVNGAGVAGDGNITSTDLDVSGDTNALLGDVVIDINAAAVTTTKIADDAVTAAKINADVAGEGLEKNTTTGVLDVSVDNATIEIDATNGLQVLANGITVTQIADNAVTPLKIDATIAGTGLNRNTTTGILSIDNTAIIGDGNITSDDLTVGGTANGLLENVTLEIAAGKVGTTELADDSVTSSKIANGTIIEEDLANNAITTTKIADLNVTSAKLANDAIITSKILDANVTPVKIAPSTTNGQVLTTTGGATVWATPTTGIPTGTAGSIFFSDGAGNLVEDNAQFFWDATSNRLGVGTNTPGSKFQVTGEVRGESFASSGGTAGQPAYSFYTGTDTNTGMYRPAADEIGFSVGGIEALHIEEAASTTTVTVREKLKLEGTLEDINNSTGTAGQVLTSTGTGTAWQTPVSPFHALGKMNANTVTNGFNIASVNDLGLGNYQVNFTTPAASDNYIIQLTLFGAPAGSTIQVTAQTTTSFIVQISEIQQTVVNVNSVFLNIDDSTEPSITAHDHTGLSDPIPDLGHVINPIDATWYFTITDF